MDPVRMACVTLLQHLARIQEDAIESGYEDEESACSR